MQRGPLPSPARGSPPRCGEPSRRKHPERGGTTSESGPDHPAGPDRAARRAGQRRRDGRVPRAQRRLDVQPDHGEQSYKGSNRLEGRRRSSRAATPGSAGPWRWRSRVRAPTSSSRTWSRRRRTPRRPFDSIEDAGPQGGLRARKTCAKRPSAGRSSTRRCASSADLRAGQQRRVPDVSGRRDRRDHHGAVRPGDEDQRVRPVLVDQGRRPAHAARARRSSRRRRCRRSPSPHLLDYATSKAAIINFTKGLAADLVEKGIRVNSVARVRCGRR